MGLIFTAQAQPITPVKLLRRPRPRRHLTQRRRSRRRRRAAAPMY